jgi:membrane-bound lytic murein transglycosylase A
MNRESLQQAVTANIEYLHSKNQEENITIADRTFPRARLIRSLEFFLQLLDNNPTAEKLNRLIRDNFDVFQATGTKGINLRRKMLVTGYFQPVFEGSLKRKAPFLYPLYSTPPDLVQIQNSLGEKSIGRMEGDKLVPYWTREEIELRQKAAGLEIVWLKDPFDAFVLHVQGSGLIRLQDGSIRGIHYAAKNGRQYKSIGKHMVQTKRITLEEASLKTIREYLENHPLERDSILFHNPSYIFFNWSTSRGAIGNLGKELTAGRSVAVDQNCFPPGALGFLFTRKPIIHDNQKIQWNPLHRFVVVQDTGSAIRGPGRVDLFWGPGPEAGIKAGQMKEPGTLYFFILKERVQEQKTS